MSAQAIEKLHEIFCMEIGVEADELSADMAYGSLAEWDSVAHMHMISALEEAFEIEFSDDEIGDLTTLAALEAKVSKLAAAA